MTNQVPPTSDQLIDIFGNEAVVEMFETLVAAGSARYTEEFEPPDPSCPFTFGPWGLALYSPEPEPAAA